MASLNVRLKIKLDTSIVEAELAKGWTKKDILKEIETEIHQGLVGGRITEGRPYIQAVEVVSIRMEER